MGLIVSVFRSDLGDCTNGGISSTTNKLTLVNVEGPFKPSDDAPAAVLVKGPTLDPKDINVVVKPLDYKKKWYMFGGNFAHTSDSRFHEAVAQIAGVRINAAVKIHDRNEG